MEILLLGAFPHSLSDHSGQNGFTISIIPDLTSLTRNCSDRVRLSFSTPLCLIIDLESLSAEDSHTLSQTIPALPTALLADRVPDNYYELLCRIRPFSLLTKREFLASPETCLSALGKAAVSARISQLHSLCRQDFVSDRLNTSESFHEINSGSQTPAISKQIAEVLCSLSISSVHMICLCSSDTFTVQQRLAAEKVIAQESSLFFLIPYTGDFWILGSSVSDETLLRLLNALKFPAEANRQNSVPKVSSSEFSIGISKRISVSSDMNLYIGFEQAKTATEINFYEKKELVFFTDSLFSRSHDVLALISHEKELSNAILTGYQERELLTILNGYMDYFRSNRIHPALVHDAVYRFLNSLDRMFKFIDPLCSIDLSLLSQKDIDSQDTLERLYAFLAEMLADFLHRGEHYEQSSSRHILEIQSYIENHLDSQLSLTAIEQEFFVNKYVFCRQFKKITGQTFNKYVKNLRLQKSLEFLKNTDTRIYEIAYRLGFQDESYFSILFKKEFGISPTEYRLQNRHKG